MKRMPLSAIQTDADLEDYASEREYNAVRRAVIANEIRWRKRVGWLVVMAVLFFVLERLA